MMNKHSWKWNNPEFTLGFSDLICKKCGLIEYELSERWIKAVEELNPRNKRLKLVKRYKDKCKNE